jgi:hypothetical protein
MRSCITAIFIFLFATGNLYSQASSKVDSLVAKIADSLVKVNADRYSQSIKDSMIKLVKDSLRWQKLKSTAIFPVIKNSEWSAAFPVSQVSEKPDPSIKYKLLFNMTIWSKDSISLRRINEGFAEIGRIINLHVAAGIPIENLELAVVIHGSALNTYLKNDVYLRKFKTDNPNLELIKQLIALHTKLLACGQAELFFRIPPEDMIPEVRTAYSAQVVLSTYQLKGYVLFNIQEEK